MVKAFSSELSARCQSHMTENTFVALEAMITMPWAFGMYEILLLLYYASF